MSQTTGDSASPNDDVSTEAAPPRAKKKAILSKRVGVLMGGCAVGVVAIVLYSNLSRPREAATTLPTAPAVKNIQGANPVTPLYAAQRQQVDQQNYTAAVSSGTSSFPLPEFNPTTGSNQTPDVDQTSTSASAPALDTTTATSITPAPTSTTSTTTATSYSSSQATASGNNPYSAMLANLLGSEVPQSEKQPSGGVTFVPAADLNSQSLTPESDTHGASGTSAAEAEQVANNQKYVPAPGTLISAEMINGLNSDAPGPALALITSGPLQGARVIGNFTTDRAGLVLSFSTMTVPLDGGQKTVTVPIQADAISETGDQVQADVNNHFLENAAVTFLAGFGQGMGTLLSQSGSTTVTTGTGTAITENPTLSTEQELGAAAGGAVGAVGNQFQQTFGNRPPTITIEPGTSFTLAFLGNEASSTQSTGGVPLSRIVPSVGGLPADTATVEQQTPPTYQTNNLQ
jgi:intracellular multiplication protein IcmE